jgi:hypothetical protein
MGVSYWCLAERTGGSYCTTSGMHGQAPVVRARSPRSWVTRAGCSLRTFRPTRGCCSLGKSLLSPPPGFLFPCAFRALPWPADLSHHTQLGGRLGAPVGPRRARGRRRRSRRHGSCLRCALAARCDSGRFRGRGRGRRRALVPCSGRSLSLNCRRVFCVCGGCELMDYLGLFVYGCLVFFGPGAMVMSV